MLLSPARLVSLPQRFPRAALVIVAAVTLVLGAYAVCFRVDSAVDQLLPTGDPDGLYYDGVRHTFGSEEIAVVGLFADDVFAPATLARIDRLTRAFEQMSGVQDVTSLTNLQRMVLGADGLSREQVMPPLPLSAEQAVEFRRQALADRIAERAIVSSDSRASGLWIRFKPISDEEFIADGLEDRLRAIIAANPGPEAVAVTGLPTIKVQAARSMIADLALFVPVSLLLVTGVLIWAFRTWRGLLLPLATVVVGLLWTIGVMVAAGDAFTMGTLVLPPLLMATGVAYAIHVVTRYYLEVRDDRTASEAVSAAVSHIGLPISMAALTTLIGFGTFVWSPIPSIRDFGIYSALGITVVFVACMVLIPAALTLLPTPPAVPSRLEEGGSFSRFVVACGTLSIHYRGPILTAFAVLVAWGAWGVTRIRVDTDYLRFFHPNSAVRIENERIGAALAGTQVVSVVVDGGGPETVTHVASIEAIRDLQRFIERQNGVDKTLSLVDHLDRVRGALTPERVGQPFADQAEVDQLLNLLTPRDIRHEVSPDLSRANLTVQTRLSGSQEIDTFVERVEAYGAAHGPPGTRVRGTGTVVLLNRSADALAWSQVVGDGQVMVILLILMSVLLRSFRLGLLSMVPNVFPIVMLLGIMGWLGIDLNICTSTIASISIGIAVDDTIHYMLGFHHELGRGLSREDAILHTLSGVGRPILITSTALAAGFLIVCLSSFQPVRHFGFLSSVTMVIGVFTDLFLLPALLVTLRVGAPAREAERHGSSAPNEAMEPAAALAVPPPVGSDK